MRGFLVLGLSVLGCSCSSDDTPSSTGTTPQNDAGAPAATTPTGTAPGTPAGTPPGPTGAGIAAKYPGDVGIEADPDVIFADSFEAYGAATDLTQKWSNYFQPDQTRIVTDPANVMLGSKALELNLPQQDNELSNGVQKILTTELDVLYLRYYSKFDTSFDITGSSHNGGGINAHYFNGNQATPGVKADGRNKFLVEYECWRGEASNTSPGVLNAYVYHPAQRSDYGDLFFTTGSVTPYDPVVGNKGDFGGTFASRPDITPELGRWYAYELMLKANTPGQRDGRITLWLDGQVIGDFPNLRFRDVDTLKIDRFNLSFHAGSNTKGPTKKWYDAVVAAKSYIGPVAGM
ncbi:MAG: hypothetical protein U0270_02285 [Labilithrix sp.]